MLLATRATVALRPAMVAVGSAMASLAVKVTVTVLPGFAHTGFGLFDAMATDVSVGVFRPTARRPSKNENE